MSESTIPAHYKSTFNSNVELALQQRKSRLEAYVRVEDQTGEKEFYDRVGEADTKTRVGRAQKTEFVDLEHGRRMVTMETEDWAGLIDKVDKRKMVLDPTSVHVHSAVAAHMRARDKKILGAAFAPAWAGQLGTEKITFPSANIVAVDYVETGAAVASGLTLEKLRRANEILGLADDVEPGEGEPEMVMAVTQHQISNLLRTTQVTNSDYNTVKALVAGTVDTFLGFKFIKLSTKVMDVLKTGTVRKCVAWKKNGLLLTKNGALETKMSERDDLSYAMQIFVTQNVAATRMWEELVVEIDCSEA